MSERDQHWTRGATWLAEGGPARLLTELRQLPDDEQAEVAAAVADGALAKAWPGKDFDTLSTVVVGCLDLLEPLSDAAESPARREALSHEWIATCYNLCTELCDCWPDDDRPREPRHHEIGLACAERCAAGRARFGELKHSRSMNLWAKGAHLRSLGRLDEALAAFEASLAAAEQECGALGETTELSSAAPYHILLGHGEVAVTALALGDPTAGARLAEVRQAFTVQSIQGGRLADEARFGLACLAKVARNLRLEG